MLQVQTAMNETIILQYFIEELDANCSLLDMLQDGFDGPYCNATTDQIGTCWPKTSAGELVERPCPEFINGVKYNTTRKCKPTLLSFPFLSFLGDFIPDSVLRS
ncbi:hypothetical protein JD844_003662 [Phrynosoma platyrhinos]|uniref:G-protein coupled receptors family 2 profile 1 domain-containing protein n=1 Tax=Phrynosoma platyrhinos TaxID=52577 RepID=A0ABQ7TDP8_PHRPL|nr:hypothetical protein JD844_003662 [Phrynosoma platyrhinos]